MTGGSSGIGKAIAIECYRQGAFITLVARDEVSKHHTGINKSLFFFHLAIYFLVKNGNCVLVQINSVVQFLHMKIQVLNLTC